jgi:hypothetical protein
MGVHFGRPEHPKNKALPGGDGICRPPAPGRPRQSCPVVTRPPIAIADVWEEASSRPTVAKLKCGYRGGGKTRKAPPRLRFAPGDESGAPLSAPRKGTTPKKTLAWAPRPRDIRAE